MGDHQTGDPILGDNFLGQLQHLFRSGGVQSSGVFVQKQQLGGHQSGHQQGQGLTLAAGEKTHRVAHAVFQSQSQLSQPIPELGTIPLVDHGEGRGVGRCSHVGQGQIFLNGHVGCSALQRILEHTADELAALVVRQIGDVAAVQGDGTAVHHEGTGDGIEQCGLACTVGTENGDEIPLVQMQVQIGQGLLFVDGAGIEGLGDVMDFQHLTYLP